MHPHRDREAGMGMGVGGDGISDHRHLHDPSDHFGVQTDSSLPLLSLFSGPVCYSDRFLNSKA